MSSPVATAVPTAAPGARSGTLLRGSMMRFASDGSGVVLGMVSGIATARVLGPTGKGTLAALTFVTILVIQCSTLGLGDAAVVRIGQAQASAQEALSSSLVAVTLASLGGACIVLAYSALQLPIHDPGIVPAVAISCLTVVIASVGQLLVFLIYAGQRVVAVSVLTIAGSTTTTAAVLIFCVLFDFAVFGAVLAGLVAAVVAFTAATVMLRRAKLRLRPRLSNCYLRPALSFGLRAQLANVLAYSSARVDLLLVYALASHNAAGLYSVALTLGTVSGFAAIALSYASFPRMARMADREALALTAEMARFAMVLGIALAAILAVALSAVIGVLLGSAYGGALVPGIVLLLGNVLWGEQWLLSRALAALGNPELLVRSFALNLLVMAGADLVLIPIAGALGAAVGSFIAPCVSLALCLRTYRARGVRLASFVPRVADLVRMMEMVQRTGRAAARAGLQR